MRFKNLKDIRSLYATTTMIVIGKLLDDSNISMNFLSLNDYNLRCLLDIVVSCLIIMLLFFLSRADINLFVCLLQMEMIAFQACSSLFPQC